MPTVPEHIAPSPVQTTEIPITFTEQHDAQLIQEVKKAAPEARKPFDQQNLSELRHLIVDVLDGEAKQTQIAVAGSDTVIEPEHIQIEPKKSLSDKLREVGESFKIQFVIKGTPPRLTDSKNFLDAAIRRSESKGEKLTESKDSPSPAKAETAPAIETPGVQEVISPAPQIVPVNAESVQPITLVAEQNVQANAEQEMSITPTVIPEEVAPVEKLAPHVPGPIKLESTAPTTQSNVIPLPVAPQNQQTAA